MKIVVINGTEVKGCTYHIKEAFLDVVREKGEITEFYLPKDLPHFCTGCKTCFFKSEALCPHAKYVMPIWESMLESDLLVFSAPVYAMRTTGQMKAFLDHLAVHWMVHRPDERMFHKKAAILTNAIGPLNGGAQRDIATSLQWLGVSDIRKWGTGLFEGVIWSEISKKRQNKITEKVQQFAKHYERDYTPRKGLKVRLLFALCKKMHLDTSKKEDTLSADNQHWVDKGWIKPKMRA